MSISRPRRGKCERHLSIQHLQRPKTPSASLPISKNVTCVSVNGGGCVESSKPNLKQKLTKAWLSGSDA